MTIKEIETITGIPRASIRFYEKEGLLSPARQENGYRIYSDADMEQLKKLRLLRALGLSLEEIRSAMEGQSDLCSLLQARTEAIHGEQAALQNADRVCSLMCREQVAYDTLDADRYLEDLQQTALPATDVLPRVQAPWQRYFARYLDAMLYMLLFSALLTWTTQADLLNGGMGFQISRWLSGLILMLVLEPVWLHLCGTTPGKWIFGLSVTDPDGGRLSWAQALDRTFFVLRWGRGFEIPFYSLWRYWKSYEACRNGESLPWEEDSILIKKSCPVRTWILFPLTLLLVLALVLGLDYIQAVPDLRGDLTLEDFSRNYNQMVTVHAEGADRKLNSKGLWDSARNQNAMDIEGMTNRENPDFQYTLDRDTVTGIRLELGSRGDDWISAMTQERRYAVSSFVRAKHGLMPLGDETGLVLQKLEQAPLESWTVTANGVRVSNQVRIEGYDYLSALGILIPTEEVPPEFSMVFSMELAD